MTSQPDVMPPADARRSGGAGRRRRHRELWGVAAVFPLVISAEVTVESGPARNTLIELYTSEGCSSCPAAEKWLGNLRHDNRLWQEFVPVAFHVHYWDQLGWPDVLASKAYTDRQSGYAAAWKARTIYTPGFVRNGEEWRPEKNFVTDPEPAASGRLTVVVTDDGKEAMIIFVPAVMNAPDWPDFTATVALLGGGIVRNVRRGENAGRRLEHEFAVLCLTKGRLQRDGDGIYTRRIALAAPKKVKAPRRAIAAWISARGTLAPLQVAGGWLD